MSENEQISFLLDALDYYANEAVYETHPDMQHTATPPVLLDHGKRARSALDEFAARVQ